MTSASHFLFILPQLDAMGGQQRQALNLCHALRSVSNISVVGLSRRSPELVADFQMAGAEVLLPDRASAIACLSIAGRRAGMDKLLADMPQAFPVIWNPFFGNEATILAARRAGRACVVCAQNVLSEELRQLPPGYRRHIVPITRLANGFIACSETVAKDLVECFGVDNQRCDVLPNCGAINAVGCRGSAEREHNLVIQVGRICPQKNNRLFVEIAHKLHELNQDLRFAIVGQAPSMHADYAAQVHNDIKSRGLSEVLQITGWVRDAGIWLRRAGLMVMTSDFEGSSLALQEAMAVGCPVLATPVGDAPQQLGGGAGVLTFSRQPEVIAAQIQKMLDHPEQLAEMGRIGRHQMATAARQCAERFMGHVQRFAATSHTKRRYGGGSETIRRQTLACWSGARHLIIYGAGADAEDLVAALEAHGTSGRVEQIWVDQPPQTTIRIGQHEWPCGTPHAIGADRVVLIASSAFEPLMKTRLMQLGLRQRKGFLTLTDINELGFSGKCDFESVIDARQSKLMNKL